MKRIDLCKNRWHWIKGKYKRTKMIKSEEEGRSDEVAYKMAAKITIKSATAKANTTEMPIK